MTPRAYFAWWASLFLLWCACVRWWFLPVLISALKH